MTKNNFVIEDDNGNCFELSYSEKVYIMILIYSWSLSGKPIHISIMNIFK